MATKNTSNPFKKAAEKQKKSPGGERAQMPVAETPAVETSPAPVIEAKPAETKPVEPTPAPAEVPVQTAPKAEPVDMMSFYKEQNKAPKKDEKVRKQFVIPKSIDDKLKKAMKNKEIPSENQLINDLLKNFFDGKLLYRE